MKELDINTPQKTTYAVPLWLRDEQIKQAVARVPGRIQPSYEKRPEPVAVVGFGPSLNDTWEQIRQFPFIITCSGSHRFLIDRGIIPNWHIEVDPRAHKIILLGKPHPDVEYLVSSTCHPDYFTHLSGFNVKLWHVFDASEDGKRLLPHGEWALTGGCDVGLRALTIAAFLGFRDLHVFGLDGSSKGPDCVRHAAAHPNGKQVSSYCDYEGTRYWTTPGMLEAARQTIHELKQMPAVRTKFYGEGLTQALVRDYVPDMKEPSEPMANVIGFSKPELISSEYCELNAKLHSDNLAYGVGGSKHATKVLSIVEVLSKELDHAPSVLDYGCGKGYLAKSLPFPIWEYDPAIPGKEESPRPADLVVCTDVLEHIEPDYLNFVLEDLKRCIKQIGYLVIHTGPASKTLPDGRNTHLIQKPLKWWHGNLSKFFQIGKVIENGPMLYVVVAPKMKKKKKVA